MAKKNKQVPRNDLQYEQLASEYLIKATPKLDEYSLVAHNLYNRALFDLRQGFFKKKYIKGADFSWKLRSSRRNPSACLK